MPPRTPAEWNQRYIDADTPWDSGLASPELARVLDEGLVPPGRAIELGCGTGVNAVYLAKHGFGVTAVDCAPLALQQARELARREGADVAFLEADVCDFGQDIEPFDFVFDRGCYHCARLVDLPGFLRTLSRITRPGSRYLLLAGNANEESEAGGPPRVHAHEIREELGELFTLDAIREFRFQDPGGVEGPLGWSCLLTRRGPDGN